MWEAPNFTKHQEEILVELFHAFPHSWENIQSASRINKFFGELK